MAATSAREREGLAICRDIAVVGIACRVPGAATYQDFWELLRERGSQGPGAGRVGYARGRVVTVESHPAQPVQLDGEPHGTTPFTATAVQGAIHVLAPAPR